MKRGRIELEISDSGDEDIRLGQKRPAVGIQEQESLKRQKLENSREASTTNITSNEMSNQPVLSNEALIVRGRFPQIVISKNVDEENWRCDICLSKLDEEEDELAICDLCNVVVHPSCYRRDLYEQDPDDESSWFCSRCQFLLQTEFKTVPSCMLCPDIQGAMVDLQTKEWVHITCVNWITDIWFEEKDTKLENFGGQLDFSKFNIKCYICNKKEGQCIECDISTCRKPFHVRCAIDERLIISREEMDQSLRLGSWECKVYCDKHTRTGKKFVKNLKNIKEMQSQGEVLQSDQESDDRPKTRLKTERLKRESVINQINIDRIISDGESSEIIIKASLDDDTPTQRITAKKSKNKIAPLSNIMFVDDVAQDIVAVSQPKLSDQKAPPLFLDIPKPVVQKKEMPMILNTKCYTKPPAPMVINNPMLRKKLTLEDITTFSQQKFKVDKQLATYLSIDEWCTFKDMTIGLLKFNKKVGDFYCKKTLTFQLTKYPFFMRFFPQLNEISSLDVKKYLLAKHV